MFLKGQSRWEWSVLCCLSLGHVFSALPHSPLLLIAHQPASALISVTCLASIDIKVCSTELSDSQAKDLSIPHSQSTPCIFASHVPFCLVQVLSLPFKPIQVLPFHKASLHPSSVKSFQQALSGGVPLLLTKVFKRLSLSFGAIINFVLSLD